MKAKAIQYIKENQLNLGSLVIALLVGIFLPEHLGTALPMFGLTATFAFKEDNGAATGSPARGTTAGTTVTTCNWKNADDATATAYSAAPITAGNNSFSKYQWGAFSGTYNQLSAGLWSPHTAGTLGTGLTLVGKVSSTYATPSTTALSSATDYSSIVAIGSGATVLFSPDGNPYTASPQASQTANPSATQYLISQLQTSGSAAPGDIASITLTLQYNEN
ncbi:MAG TPA: hypothetical protein VGE62_01145 [Candidatus Paceibacterota bacterium]